MKLFIDCEWNSYKGDLLSLALVAEDGSEFYEVMLCRQPLAPWVIENVLPKLQKEGVEKWVIQQQLSNFLNRFEAVHIVADWPEDIAHFCNLLITGPGERITYPPLTMEVIPVDSVSEVPHNALWDARGLMSALCKE